MVRVWVAIVAAALLAVPGGSLAKEPTPNVRGLLTRGPVFPVCFEGRPCDGPAPGVVLVFSYSGREVKRVTTGSEGRFALRLRPGFHSVRTSRRPLIGSGLSPTRFRVPKTGVMRLRLYLDTGIR